MADYAPSQLVNAGRRVAKDLGGTLSGVLGDRAHTYGYHRGRNMLPSYDYSVKLSLDKQGPSSAASAMDITLSQSQMKVVTKRLRASALDPNDPRMEPVREFYGTLNGGSVFGMMKDDLDGPWYSSTADNSHLWHIHISFFRKFSTDSKAIEGVMDVMRGKPWKGGSATSTVRPPRYQNIRTECYVYPTQQPGTVPLYQYWNKNREDNFLTATEAGRKSAVSAGYRFVRIEGYIYPKQQSGTVPAQTYWAKSIEDNILVCSAATKRSLGLGKDGYQFIRTEGYAYPSQVPGTVPLTLYWDRHRQDNFHTATTAGHKSVNYGK